MPNFEISINVYILLLIIVTAMMAGFLGRSKQLAKKDRTIAGLERDMMQAYAELLDTQRDYCELESKVRDAASPVIAMKSSKNEEQPMKSSDHVQDRLSKDRPTGSG